MAGVRTGGNHAKPDFAIEIKVEKFRDYKGNNVNLQGWFRLVLGDWIFNDCSLWQNESHSGTFRSINFPSQQREDGGSDPFTD